MSVDLNLLKILMDCNREHSPKYVLWIDGTSYSISSVSITNSPTPVSKPMTRGGVYFSDKFAYKMRGIINDVSVVPLLTSKMLGPNTDFDDLKITTEIESDGKILKLEIFTNLTNSVQIPDSIELSMIIVNLSSV